VMSGSAHVKGLLDMSYVRRAFNAHRTGAEDNWYLLWAVWVLERWAARQDRLPRMPTSEVFA
jgi:hypothetical protein